MSCPFFTLELKSAYQAWMRPETWLPTCTVTIAETAAARGDLGFEGSAVDGRRLVADRRRRRGVKRRHANRLGCRDEQEHESPPESACDAPRPPRHGLRHGGGGNRHRGHGRAVCSPRANASTRRNGDSPTRSLTQWMQPGANAAPQAMTITRASSSGRPNRSTTHCATTIGCSRSSSRSPVRSTPDRMPSL